MASDDDLIRRGDALAACAPHFQDTIRSLPAVTVGVPCTWPICGHTAKGQCQGTGVRTATVGVGVKPLRDLLEAWVELASHCTIEEGVCCCGDSIEGHSHYMNCGHAPVDHGSYIADGLVERTLAALEPVTQPDPAAIREAARVLVAADEAEKINLPIAVVNALTALIKKGAADDRA